jgi:hypothetical protein
MSDILRAKEYPTNYPSDAINILDAMSMGDNIHLVGSMSLRSQQYAGDYDGYEVVSKRGVVKKVLVELRERFQSNIQKLRNMKNVYIGDMKIGVIDAWRVIPRTALVRGNKIEGYNAVACRSSVDELLKSNVITQLEAKEAHALLKDQPTVPEFLMAKDKIKFHVLRWTVAEAMANHKQLRGGGSITLEQAFHTPGITKVDVIGLVQNNRFTDFSVIYEFKCNGKVLNPEPVNIRVSLEENILAYLAEGNYFKVLKRLFALAKFVGDNKTIKELNEVLNSDLGRLYHIVGDMDTLLALLSSNKPPIAPIRFEIDQFIQRLSTIYTLDAYLKKDDDIVGEIRRILKMPEHRIAAPLEKLRNELDDILQQYAKPIVKRLRSIKM